MTEDGKKLPPIRGEAHIVEQPDIVEARIVFKETGSTAANTALVAITSLPQTREGDALAHALETIGSASRDQLVLWEAKLLDPDAPIPSTFSSLVARESLLSIVRRVMHEADLKRAADQSATLTSKANMYGIVGAIGGAVVTAGLTFLLTLM